MRSKKLSLALFSLMLGLFLASAGMADLIGYWRWMTMPATSPETGMTVRPRAA